MQGERSLFHKFTVSSRVIDYISLRKFTHCGLPQTPLPHPASSTHFAESQAPVFPPPQLLSKDLFLVLFPKVLHLIDDFDLRCEVDNFTPPAPIDIHLQILFVHHGRAVLMKTIKLHGLPLAIPGIIASALIISVDQSTTGKWLCPRPLYTGGMVTMESWRDLPRRDQKCQRTPLW